MAEKKYVGAEALIRLVAQLKTGFASMVHKHKIKDIEDYVVDVALSDTSTNPVENKAIKAEFQAITNILTSKADVSDLTNGSFIVKNAEHAGTTDFAANAENAIKATQDASGNIITGTYETKTDASAKLEEAKSYADSAATTVKNDLLNGAGEAYDTLKELGELIDENHDAIEVLEAVATNKADKEHTHIVSDITDMPEIANADWNENDETSPAYICNRPFYVSGYSIGFDPAQDGVSESRYIDMSMRYVGSYNVDEWTTSAESLVGATIAGSNSANIFGTNRTDIENENGVTCEQVVTYDDCVSVGTDSSYVMFEGAHKACIVFVSETDAGTTAFDLPCYGATGSTMQITFPLAGMWVMKYASSVQITSIEFREYKTLDQRFLPDSVATITYVDEAVANIDIPEQVQADWSVNDETSPAYIKNKPTEEDALMLLMEFGMIEPAVDADGTILTDENGYVFSY